jgi:SAM-dependent methyltransferase
MRERAYGRCAHQGIIGELLAEALIDRLAMVQRDFGAILLCGRNDRLETALAQRGEVTVTDIIGWPGARQPDRIGPDDAPLASDDSYDCIVNVGLLDSLDDIPGALLLVRRALRGDGLFLAGMIGADSFAQLRDSLIVAQGDQVSPRMHPLLDVRTAGDLLVRAGFALPVTDIESSTLAYRRPAQLFADIRDYGGANMMSSVKTALGRGTYQRLHAALDQRRDAAGKLPMTLNLLYLQGWKPHVSQPKPARRGSATVSLAQALRAADNPKK